MRDETYVHLAATDLFADNTITATQTNLKLVKLDANGTNRRGFPEQPCCRAYPALSAARGQLRWRSTARGSLGHAPWAACHRRSRADARSSKGRR